MSGGLAAPGFVDRFETSVLVLTADAFGIVEDGAEVPSVGVRFGPGAHEMATGPGLPGLQLRSPAPLGLPRPAVDLDAMLCIQQHLREVEDGWTRFPP
jgi:hypothetical protein